MLTLTNTALSSAPSFQRYVPRIWHGNYLYPVGANLSIGGWLLLSLACVLVQELQGVARDEAT